MADQSQIAPLTLMLVLDIHLWLQVMIGKENKFVVMYKL